MSIKQIAKINELQQCFLRSLMKTRWALLVLLLMTGNVFANQFMMLGIYKTPVPGKCYYCQNMEMLQVQVPLAKREQFQETRKQFNESYKTRSPITHLLQPESATVVYAYESAVSGFNCKAQVLNVIHASDVVEADKKMQAIVAKSPKAFRPSSCAHLEWQRLQIQLVARLRWRFGTISAVENRNRYASNYSKREEYQ